jgi:SPP1 gp7 family putative phage head morphogenesis protein
MAFGLDLPEMVRAARVTNRASIDLPPIFPTANLERELASIIIAVVRYWQDVARDTLLPEYTSTLAITPAIGDRLFSDSVGSIRSRLEVAENGAVQFVFGLSTRLRTWLRRFDLWHRGRFVQVVTTATTVNLETMIGRGEDRETIEAAFARNIDLIRSVSDDTRRAIADITWRGFTARTPRRDLAREINAATGMSRKRAIRIASDQTTKLSALLDEERQREAGIDQFVWVHSGKLHYRPEHKARDGKVYSWNNNNLRGDLPGVAINCGCKARAHINLD